MPDLSETDPHALLLLMVPDSGPGYCHLWRDEVPPLDFQPGDLVPLPDAAMEAAGDQFESAGLVEASCHPSSLPTGMASLLPAPPGPGCRVVIVVRVIAPEVCEDGFVMLGDFDPGDAKRLLRLLEGHEVPFEIETDHSALLQPGRSVALYLGMNPTGSRVNVYVPVAHLPHSRKILRYLYPPEAVPSSRPLKKPSIPSPVVPMEVYTTPSAEVSLNRHREFYARPEADHPPNN